MAALEKEDNCKHSTVFPLTCTFLIRFLASLASCYDKSEPSRCANRTLQTLRIDHLATFVVLVRLQVHLRLVNQLRGFWEIQR